MALSTVATLTSLDVPAQPNLETRLVAASRSGDRDAFGDLVRLYERRVYRLAGRFFRAREDVEEAAQETFLTAWAKLGTYRAEAPFEHWLTRVCLNTCYQHLRKARSTEELSETGLPAQPEADADARLEVERLLATLPAKDRFLLLMLHGEEWSVAEIADKLGWSKANVKVRAHRARARLRKLLEESTR